MSLMLSAPKSRATLPAMRVPQPRRNPPRRRGRSYERQALPDRFKPAPGGLRTASEEEVASMLECARLRFSYEPTSFPLGADTAFKPDFYLGDEDLYLEVTEGNALRQAAKRAKIKRVGQLYGVRVVLIGPDELQAFRDGKLTLWDVIHGLSGTDPLD